MANRRLTVGVGAREPMVFCAAQCQSTFVIPSPKRMDWFTIIYFIWSPPLLSGTLNRFNLYFDVYNTVIIRTVGAWGGFNQFMAAEDWQSCYASYARGSCVFSAPTEETQMRDKNFVVNINWIPSPCMWMWYVGIYRRFGVDWLHKWYSGERLAWTSFRKRLQLQTASQSIHMLFNNINKWFIEIGNVGLACEFSVYCISNKLRHHLSCSLIRTRYHLGLYANMFGNGQKKPTHVTYSRIWINITHFS